MSAGRQGKHTNWPDDIIGTRAVDETNAQWGEIPGEIVSFNPQKQTATIRPLFRPKHNGKPVDMPELLEVPVRFTRAGFGGITFPIQAKDRVTLRPQMRSSEKYHSDDKYEATDARSFNLSDYEAHLDGGEPLKDPIPNFDNMNAHIRFNPEGTYGIRGSKDGKVAIQGKEGNIYELLVQVVELLAADTLVIKYGSSSGSGHQLEYQAQYAAIAAKLRAMAL
jgi:hypothetical protein